MSNEALVSDKRTAFDGLIDAVDRRIEQHKRDLTAAAARGEPVDRDKMRNLSNLTIFRKCKK